LGQKIILSNITSRIDKKKMYRIIQKRGVIKLEKIQKEKIIIDAKNKNKEDW